MKKYKGNYLDLIPTIKENLKWQTDENGSIIIICEHKGITNKIATKVFGMPKETKVHLEEFGNFIWKLIDGKNSVYDIAHKVKEEYGEKAEPLYERICKYFGMLEDNGFVEMKEQGE